MAKRIPRAIALLLVALLVAAASAGAATLWAAGLAGGSHGESQAGKLAPPTAGNCPTASLSALITGLGVRSITAPTSSTPVTIKIYLALSAASPAGVLGLHELADISLGTTLSASKWTAQLAYPFAASQL